MLCVTDAGLLTAACHSPWIYSVHRDLGDDPDRAKADVGTVAGPHVNKQGTDGAKRILYHLPEHQRNAACHVTSTN